MTSEPIFGEHACFQHLSEKRQAWYRKVTDNLTKQYPPEVLILEPVEGCVWRCPSCAIAGIRHRGDDGGSASDQRHMSIETARMTIKQMICLDWTDTRIELSGHGEPTLHPGLVQMVTEIRKIARWLPISVVTSGEGLLRKPGPLAHIMDLFGAGVNYLAITRHKPEVIKKIDDIVGLVARQGVQLQVFPEAWVDRPDQRVRPPSKVLAYRDPPVTEGHLHVRRRNMAGAAFPLAADKRESPCARPFREILIRHDGSVALCQDDWRGQYKCGSVVSDGLAAVWDGEPMNAARRHLMTSRHDIAMCRSCNSESVRPRHLPDPQHSMTILPPDDSTLSAVERAQSGQPYTRPVHRPWER